MSIYHCPKCNANLSAAELKEGWCEQCGKHVPEHLLSAAAREDRQHRHEHLTHKQAPLPSSPEQQQAAELDAPRPLPQGLLARAACIVLLLVALATLLFPWSSYTTRTHPDQPVIVVEQTGLQMLYGGTTIRQVGGSRSSELAKFKEQQEVRPYYVARFLIAVPLCFLLALVALSLPNAAGCWRWAATWSALAVLVVLMQLAEGFPPTLGGSRFVSPALWTALAASFLVVMVAVWPAADAAEGSAGAWALAAPLLLVVLALYAGAFAMPVTVSREASPLRPTSLSHDRHDDVTVQGWEVFGTAYDHNDYEWYAHPLAWIAWLLLLCRRWLWAAGAAALAGWILLLPYLHLRLDGATFAYTWGYWLWLASLALLLIGSLAGSLVWRPART